METVTRRLTILNKRGLHARASAKFVQTVEKFDASVAVAKDGMRVGGTSIMGLMMLAAGINSTIVVSAAGAEAEAALMKRELHEQIQHEGPDSVDSTQACPPHATFQSRSTAGRVCFDTAKPLPSYRCSCCCVDGVSFSRPASDADEEERWPHLLQILRAQHALN